METADPNLVQAIAGAYEILILSLGVLAVGFTIWRWPRWQATRRELGSWPLSWMDFGLFLFAIIVATIYSGVVGGALSGLLAGTPKGEEPPEALVAALSSLLMQACFILCFWQWRQLHRSEAEGPINSQSLSLGGTLGFGVLLVAATYPVILITSLAWQMGLQVLTDWGVPIQLEEQFAVELFRDTDQWWILALLGFSAVILAPIGEELVFRAGLYRFLLGRTSKPNAIVMSGLFFGLVHFNLYGFAPLAALGILLCLAYDITGNIRVPILIHVLFNAHTVLLLLLFPDVVGLP